MLALEVPLAELSQLLEFVLGLLVLLEALEVDDRLLPVGSPNLPLPFGDVSGVLDAPTNAFELNPLSVVEHLVELPGGVFLVESFLQQLQLSLAPALEGGGHELFEPVHELVDSLLLLLLLVLPEQIHSPELVLPQPLTRIQGCGFSGSLIVDKAQSLLFPDYDILCFYLPLAIL